MKYIKPHTPPINVQIVLLFSSTRRYSYQALSVPPAPCALHATINKHTSEFNTAETITKQHQHRLPPPPTLLPPMPLTRYHPSPTIFFPVFKVNIAQINTKHHAHHYVWFQHCTYNTEHVGIVCPTLHPPMSCIDHEISLPASGAMALVPAFAFLKPCFTPLSECSFWGFFDRTSATPFDDVTVLVLTKSSKGPALDFFWWWLSLVGSAASHFWAWRVTSVDEDGIGWAKSKN
jgi:hypothetical protein